jgi:sulfur-carrier protein
MRITLRLFATLQQGRSREEVREVPPGTTVSRVVEDLHLPGKEIKVILVNSRHADLSLELSDGDTLVLFPLVDGG